MVSFSRILSGPLQEKNFNIFFMYKKYIVDHKVNRNSNIYIGAQICAYAREVIYDHMLKIEQVGGVIYAVDVDGLFFSLKKDTPDPLLYSNVCGDFKKMLDDDQEIAAFYCLGSRNYSFLLQDGEKNFSSVVKIKGLSLSSHALKNVLSAETYKASIENVFQNQVTKIIIPQEKFCIDSKTRVSYKTRGQFTYHDDLYIKRFIRKDFIFNEKSRVDTLPFGYKQSLKRKADDDDYVDLFDYIKD